MTGSLLLSEVELMETHEKDCAEISSNNKIASFIGSGINGNKTSYGHVFLHILRIASFIGSGINGNQHQNTFWILLSRKIASFIGSGINGN